MHGTAHLLLTKSAADVRAGQLRPGESLAMHAVVAREPRLLDRLLRRGAPPELSGEQGRTPLAVAVGQMRCNLGWLGAVM